MKFNKIVCVDHTKLNDKAISQLQELSDAGVEVYSDYPGSKEEIINRIGDAEAIVVSWHTQIDEEIIDECSSLQYIGMACSLYDDASANVAVKYAEKKGISVKGIRDYGDPGVAEFIISELIQLLNGYKDKQWRELPVELTGLRIGIIGLGVTGQLLAKCLLPFGAELYYYSRNRKKEWEQRGITYLELPELLSRCEVVSIHLPKNAEVLGKEEFEDLGSGKILINTSLGLPFQEETFRKWLTKEGNFAIFDADAKAQLTDKSLELKNLIALDSSAGWSSKTLERLSEKVVQNLRDHCEKK